MPLLLSLLVPFSQFALVVFASWGYIYHDYITKYSYIDDHFSVTLQGRVLRNWLVMYRLAELNT